MNQAHADLTGLAIVVMGALACGIFMTRFRQPAIVGYILAGVILGPSGLKLVEDRGNVEALAELGVLMLLFLVGMELSLRGFRAVWKVALGAAILQALAGVLLMLLFGQILGWSFETAVVLGFVVALSSTAVVVKMLEQINILRQPAGQLTIGILIAQDLMVVPMMLTLGILSDATFDPLAIVKIVGSVAILVAIILYLSRRKRVVLPFARIIGGHHDLEPLAALVICFGAAALTGLLGLSPVFGAFLAGIVIGNSTARSTMIPATQPIQAVLLMVFFLSIGLLIDLAFIWENIGTVILMLFFIAVIKTVLNIGILHVLREPWPHAFIAGVMLAQIGEFSLVLGQTATASGLISREMHQLIIASVAFSLLISPLWLSTARRLLRIILLSVTSFTGTMDAFRTRRVAIVLRYTHILGQGAGRLLRQGGEEKPTADVLPVGPLGTRSGRRSPRRRFRRTWLGAKAVFLRPFGKRRAPFPPAAQPLLTDQRPKVTEESPAATPAAKPDESDAAPAAKTTRTGAGKKPPTKKPKPETTAAKTGAAKTRKRSTTAARKPRGAQKPKTND